MNTKFLSEKTMNVIEQYRNFHIGKISCPIPYYNNRHTGMKVGMKAEKGKGSPKDIYEEIKNLIILEKIDTESMSGNDLKKLLIEHNIGIDCSAFAYYILNVESENKNKGSLDKHLSYPFSKNFWRNIKAKMRPIENTDVKTLSHEKNSREIEMKNIEPGDMITMINKQNTEERNHIIIPYEIDYQDFIPKKIYYTHSIAWPTDGEYGHGIRDGIIEVIDINKSIVEQKWLENGKTENENYTYTRARECDTKIRRLNWF